MLARHSIESDRYIAPLLTGEVYVNISKWDSTV